MDQLTYNYSDLTQRLTQHQQQLVTLHVQLKQAQRQGQLSRREYQKRAESLKRAQHLQAQLHNWAAAAENHLTQETNLGLPNLETCSPEERRVCLHFLRQRFGVLETLVKMVAQTYDHLQEAIYGRFWLVACTFWFIAIATRPCTD